MSATGTKKKNFQYSEQAMINALNECRNGMAVSKSAKQFNVPKTTLFYKLKGVYPEQRKMGPATVLTSEMEKDFVEWIQSIAKAGFPATKDQILESVQMLIIKNGIKTPFRDNKPGRHWYDAFLKRHPILSSRVAQTLVKSRAILTEKCIREWFTEIQTYLMKENYMSILNDPDRVFNMDESAFFLSPKTQKVLVTKGEKAVYSRSNNDDKECLTTLVAGSASGLIPPPMVMFKYVRVPASVADKMPNHWGIGTSENGWMTGQSFFEYISNVFYPWLVRNQIEFPIVLFVDGHKSHLTLPLSVFCSENGIILIALFPNATHVLQPMDVAIFKPLKDAWKNEVQKYKFVNNGRKIEKWDFAGILEKAMNIVMVKETLQNGFRTCGLCPFNPNAINYSKLLNSHPKIETSRDVTLHQEKLLAHLAFIESMIESDKLDKFKRSGPLWQGLEEDISLFHFWKTTSDFVHQNNEHEEFNSEN